MDRYKKLIQQILKERNNYFLNKIINSTVKLPAMKTHKDLIVWKKSIEFVTDIYRTTKTFPKEELYGLTAQLRRAAVSIPSNIAEGAARKNEKEFVRFLYFSLGSFSEVETQLIVSRNLEYLTDSKLIDKSEIIGKMLVSLIKYFSKKK